MCAVQSNAGSQTLDVFEVSPPEMEDKDESADVPVLGQQENEKEDGEANSDTEATETVDENSETEATETDDDTNKLARNNDDEEVEENSDSEDEEESEAEDEDCVVVPDAPEDDDVAPAAAKKSDAFCLFTTGLGFSSRNKTRLRTVVESAAEKKTFSRTWPPDSSMHSLVRRWARKASHDFAADVVNSNCVVARGLGLGSPFDPCNLRGWILTRRAGSKGDFRVECKRFHECLKHPRQLSAGTLCFELESNHPIRVQPLGDLLFAI
jgi:hypothetical protein